MSLLAYLLLSGAWPFALAVLVGAFIVVRSRQGEGLDLASGATAYTSIVLATVAAAAAAGIANLLAGVLGAIDADFTYGSGGLSGLLLGGAIYENRDASSLDVDRNNGDFAAGLALLMTAVIFGWLHLGLRMHLDVRGLLDRGVERATEVLVAVIAGVLTVVTTGAAFAQVLQRAMVDTGGAAPGEMIATACGAGVVLLVYGARVARGLGLGPPWLWREEGSSGDEELETEG